MTRSRVLHRTADDSQSTWSGWNHRRLVWERGEWWKVFIRGVGPPVSTPCHVVRRHPLLSMGGHGKSLWRNLSPRGPGLETGWEGNRGEGGQTGSTSRSQDQPGQPLAPPSASPPLADAIQVPHRCPGSLGLLLDAPPGRLLLALPRACPAAHLGAPALGSRSHLMGIRSVPRVALGQRLAGDPETSL